MKSLNSLKYEMQKNPTNTWHCIIYDGDKF